MVMGVLHPGDILVLDPLPLAGVFGRVERECAAAIMVMAGWAVGRFAPVPMAEVSAAARRHFGRPGYRWLGNPFYKPRPHQLVQCGAATWLGGETIAFTADGLDALYRSRWCIRDLSVAQGTRGSRSRSRR